MVNDRIKKRVISMAEKQALKLQNHQSITHKTSGNKTPRRKNGSWGVDTATASPWAPPRAVVATMGSPWWWLAMPCFVLLRRLLLLDRGTCHDLSVLGFFGNLCYHL